MLGLIGIGHCYWFGVVFLVVAAYLEWHRSLLRFSAVTAAWLDWHSALLLFSV